MRTKSDEINGLFIFKITVYINILKCNFEEHQDLLHLTNIQYNHHKLAFINRDLISILSLNFFLVIVVKFLSILCQNI